MHKAALRALIPAKLSWVDKVFTVITLNEEEPVIQLEPQLPERVLFLFLLRSKIFDHA